MTLKPFSYCIMVRLAGIEPTTPWFVAKYSIQLSYSRVKRKYSTVLLQIGSPLSDFHFPAVATPSSASLGTCMFRDWSCEIFA